MQEAPPWTYDEAKVGRLRTHLSTILGTHAHLVQTGEL
jgi:hypothetical protein